MCDISQLWFSNRLFEQMQSHISCMWAIFWNVCFHMSPHRLLEKMQRHISCIFVISSIVCFHTCSQIACLNRCKVAIVADVQNFSSMIYKSPSWTDLKSHKLQMWHMSGEQPEPVQFLGNFVHHRYNYACQGHLKLYAFKYKYTFQGYMHLYAHNCIWRHGSTALRDWLKKKRNIVFF